VVDHLVHGDRQGRLHALHDHAERIADEDDVDTGCISDAAEREVVRGQCDDRVTATLALQNIRHRHFAFHKKTSWDRTRRA